MAEFLTAPTLETERLRLRPNRAEDFDRFAAFYASPRSKFVDGPVSRDKAWLMFGADVGQWGLLGFGSWAIERRADGAHVGQIGLNRPPSYPEREIGWLLWDGFEGQGYAREAARRARDFAYGTLGWDTVVSYIDPGNAASMRVAENLGATPDPDAPRPVGGPCLIYRHPPPSALRS